MNDLLVVIANCLEATANDLEKEMSDDHEVLATFKHSQVRTLRKLAKHLRDCI